MKLKKHFDITYNLKKEVVRDLKIVTDILPLNICGTFYCNTNASVSEPYERYDVDIDYILYKGADVKELLDFTGTTEDIECQIIKLAPKYFEPAISEQ